ncbi:MAG: class I SAM-dependent methyltransferase [Actinomycetota bacterium]
MATYDVIGKTYARTRRPDPRIEQQIMRALEGCASVVNVGAGTGSYEPSDRRVVAVEPSIAMIRQRGSDSAPTVQGNATSLPFVDDSFDAALASLTVHHWPDQLGGIAEMRRVARERVVIFTHNVEDLDRFWLVTDYFPQMLAFDRERFVSFERVVDVFDDVRVEPVPIPSDCIDGFLCAYWTRPEAYLDETVRNSISSFPSMEVAAVAAGIERLASDISSGRWDERYGYLRDAPEQDFGYRLIVASA